MSYCSPNREAQEGFNNRAQRRRKLRRREPIPPVAGQRELPPQALTVALTVPSKVKPAFTGKASGAIHRLPMSHAATVITSAAKKQNQYYNDQNQFHDKLQCAGFE
jgi:hypothetical protein